MTITVELRPDDEQALRNRARESGRELPEYVQHILEQHIRSGAAPRSFDQALAPVWEGWRQTGMSEEQIDAMFQRELEELRRDRLQRRGME